MTTTVNVIEIVNVAKQPIIIGVKKRVDSPIFTKDGQITILSLAKLEVEDDRLNLGQIISLQKQGVIQFSRFKRVVSSTESGSA